MGLFCPLTGTSAATANSRLTVNFENTLAEWTSVAEDFYRFNITDCGIAGYDDEDSVARATVKFRGVYDREDQTACSGEECNFFDVTAGLRIGACGVSPSLLNSICTGVDTAGNNTPDDAWEWFSVGSGNSGGPGVDGLSWRATDAHFRCLAGEECDGKTYAGVPSYTINMRDRYRNSEVSCIPKDVLGVPVCGLRLTSVNVGAR
jgi:hypothetical protein